MSEEDDWQPTEEDLREPSTPEGKKKLKKEIKEMYEEEARYNKAHFEEVQAQHARLNSTQYTNELLEENNKVLKENEKNTRAIYYALLVIGVMLAWIMFTVVFQIEPWWK